MSGWKRIFPVFKFLMAFVYLSMGVAILYFNNFLLPLNNSVRTGFGIILLIYGAFRIYTVVLNAKSDEEN